MEQQPAYFIGIVHRGNEDLLHTSLESISRQDYPANKLRISVFYPANKLARMQLPRHVHLVPFMSEESFFQCFIAEVNQSDAGYYLIFDSGDRLFGNALQVMAKAFCDYPQIAWLTGIQTVQSAGGFNIFYGSIATRRWTEGIFERNLYKKTGRYIPAGATLWKRELWDKALPLLYFVRNGHFYDDLWQAFFKVGQLYTSNIYISSTINRVRSSDPNAHVLYEPVEGGFINKIREYFFINNVPYLRLLYRTENKLAKVVRYDHKMQTCFLYDY